jgi:hypothetical protein
VRPAHVKHCGRAFFSLLLTAATLSASAYASQPVSLNVKFTPRHLGHGTTIGIDFQMHAKAGQVPSPLTGLNVTFPRQLGITDGGLGIDTCSQATLQESGPKYCPPDSHMGRGLAIAEIPIGPEIVMESASVTIVRGPEQNGHLTLLFYVNAEAPVSAQLVFPGTLLPGATPQHEDLAITVPLVPSLPAGPNVALIRINATLGPLGLTYTELNHGKLSTYQPQGILLPRRCPREGFQFSAKFAFQDDTSAIARASVGC